MNKKGEIQIDGMMIGIVILLLGVGILFVSDAFGDISFFFNNLINNPNRETNYYDVTCKVLVQDFLGTVKFDLSTDSPQYKQYAPPSCAYIKSGFFSIGSIGGLFGSDEGTVKMSVDGKNDNKAYRLEWLADSEGFDLKVNRVNKGQQTVLLQIFDETGFILDEKSISLNIGG